MLIKVLYDTRNNEIIRYQPEPFGLIGAVPSFEELCNSARISEEEKKYMDICTINNDTLLTTVKEHRIINGKIIIKPTVNISIDKQQINLPDPTFTISLEITNSIESDSFSSVQMSINDIEFTIEITNNIGSKVVELVEADDYNIKCIDNRFISQSVGVVVVE